MSVSQLIPKDNVPRQPDTNSQVATDPEGPDGPHSGGPIGERLAAIEEAISGLKRSQDLLLGAVGLGFTLVLALMIYMLTRIDNIPTEFQWMNQMLSSAITASKQQTPQVIVLPQSAIPASPSKSPEKPSQKSPH